MVDQRIYSDIGKYVPEYENKAFIECLLSVVTEPVREDMEDIRVV